MELAYDLGNGYYILDRLSTSEAMLARMRLLGERHWLPILGFAIALAALGLSQWRRARVLRLAEPRNEPMVAR